MCSTEGSGSLKALEDSDMVPFVLQINHLAATSGEPVTLEDHRWGSQVRTEAAARGELMRPEVGTRIGRRGRWGGM